MVEIKILFDSNSSVYIAGQVLKGIVEVNLTSDKQINELFILIKGKTKCAWIESRLCGKTTEHFSSEEVLLHTKVTLFGRGTLATGLHRYNFDCHLPSQLPASLEEKYGSIRYKIEVKMDIPWAIDKEFKKRFFTVLRIEDLNAYSSMRRIINVEKMTNFWFFPCRSDPLRMAVTIPRTGWAAGQMIEYTINYDNRSNVEIISTDVIFRRLITCTSQSPYKNVKVKRENICKLNSLLGGCSGNKASVHRGEISTPQLLVPSTTHGSKALEVSYELKFEAISEGMHRTIILHVPIFIGSIRLVSKEERPVIQQNQPQQPTAPPNIEQTTTIYMPSVVTPRNFLFPQNSPFPQSRNNHDENSSNDLPPPSYEDAMLLAQHRHHRR